MPMLRLGHYGCQSTTNENGFHGNRPWPGKSYTINSNLLGDNDKFFKGHMKRFKEGGASKVSPSKIKVHLRSKRLKYTCEAAHFW